MYVDACDLVMVRFLVRDISAAAAAPTTVCVHELVCAHLVRQVCETGAG